MAVRALPGRSHGRLNAAEVVQAVYRYGFDLDQPLTMRRNNVPSWYLTDPIGTVTAIADAAGNVVERYRYDAFGEVAIFDGAGAPLTASAVGNSFLFTGRELDPETGLYHYRARAYSPQLGRFLQRDPLGQIPDANVYRYTGNHPLDSTDPLGLDWLSTASNFSAGMGDAITFGATNKVRQWMGTNYVVDKCAGAYGFGQAAGTAVAAGMGGAGALKAAGSQLGKMGLKEIAKKAPRFFYDPRNFKTISREYWEARGGAGGKSLHHWLFSQKSKIPAGFRNAGFNLLELPAMRGVFHHSLGLNQWMGFAARWGGRHRLQALAMVNTIRLGIPATAVGVPIVAYRAANQGGKD